MIYQSHNTHSVGHAFRALAFLLSLESVNRVVLPNLESAKDTLDIYWLTITNISS
ncbi:hypothetical protein RchiOBHm_Chr1g0319491 [Rosa chinensis]|uniref:Uncharacterized protein n=1 Tax=Rosa chinensis TaxID=74649 RepID=A0A2P6S8E8_ROSCH|nr:hypothetical protein RchiOBHm_Chr1g0319491 [Rosa chinensis]